MMKLLEETKEKINEKPPVQSFIFSNVLQRCYTLTGVGLTGDTLLYILLGCSLLHHKKVCLQRQTAESQII